ncbi:MAG: thioredoxin-like domain-containing protein [Planctomycetaceae bacterium]
MVLLDFWTYCCINCMHVLPDLAYLESKYEKELVVIGVHSAKFENEQDSSAIRSAIQRYEIAHPVINDAEMTIWRKYRVRSWPHLVIVDPEGKYIGFVSGREIVPSSMKSSANSSNTIVSRELSTKNRYGSTSKRINSNRRRSASPVRCSPTPPVIASLFPTATTIASSSRRWRVTSSTWLVPGKLDATMAIIPRPASTIPKAWPSWAITCTWRIPKIICSARSTSTANR